jgi:hypothetical protein
MTSNIHLTKGQKLHNNEIAEIFKCSNQGGMRRSHATNTLVIISDHRKMYEDHWEGSTFYYTGMGKKGDQSLTFAQNRTLAESNTNGVDVYLFEVFEQGVYTFSGQVELVGEPFQEDQPDEDRNMRKVWIFPLKVVDEGQPLLEEIESLSETLAEQPEITETEKEQLVKSRIGQSTFKKELLRKEKKCKLCGVSDERFLVASHIKPWSKSSNEERLDANNGLLLCPNHDALFDKGYISFDSDGSILLSERLDEATKLFLNVNETMKVKISPEQETYMEWHRVHLFTN